MNVKRIYNPTIAMAMKSAPFNANLKTFQSRKKTLIATIIDSTGPKIPSISS